MLLVLKIEEGAISRSILGPLGAGRSKEIDSPLEPQKKHSPSNTSMSGILTSRTVR